MANIFLPSNGSSANSSPIHHHPTVSGDLFLEEYMFGRRRQVNLDFGAK